jgi:hypothetical protein
VAMIAIATGLSIVPPAACSARSGPLDDRPPTLPVRRP